MNKKGMNSKGSVAFVSFRLGQTDGVSVVAKTWQTAFEKMGYQTLTVAGEGPVDRLVPGLEIDAELEPARHEFEAAVSDCDLVVVENLLTIPMNLPASRIVASVLAGRPTILHHHDPPWQRARFAHVTELPAQDPTWVHVTINKLTNHEFAERGIQATTIYNAFPTPESQPQAEQREQSRQELPIEKQGHAEQAPQGGQSQTPGRLRLRDRTRNQINVEQNERLIVHPVRAIGRKGIPAAVRLAEELGATYWITGAAEEGFRPELDRILADAQCRTIHRPAPTQEALYAAADLIVFPSLWEGFGNPPIEAALHHKPVAVSHYPVAEELRGLGFDWPDLDQVDLLRQELISPDLDRISHNRSIVRQKLGMDDMCKALDQLILQAGW